MTKEEEKTVFEMRKQGIGYRTIAVNVGLPLSTIKSWCRRHPVLPDSDSKCPQCGCDVRQIPHRKKKTFCSDKCRYQWWVLHPEKRNPEKGYHHICAYCGKEFVSSRPGSRFCNKDCFANSRRRTGE